MKSSRLIVIGFIGMVLAFGLTGCITSATPDPAVPVEMRLGESKTFTVEGPAENEDTFYEWALTYPDGGVNTVQWKGKQFTFLADPQKYWLSNGMKLECNLWQTRLIYGCDPQSGCGWMLEEIPVDKRVWNIKILQDGTIWQCNYFIEDKTDISFLNGFTSIAGNLYICNTQLLSLIGLENLTSVGGELVIEGNLLLKSLTGLENLTSIGGGLVIGGRGGYNKGNFSLKNLTGLDNLKSIGGGLVIGGSHTLNNGNFNLTSLRGLENLTSIGGYLCISSNDALTSLSGLGKLKSISGLLRIDGNDALTSLTGLDNLTSIGGSLSIGGYWDGAENPALTSLKGLESLTSIGGDLWIWYSDALTNLSALENLKSVNGDLNIWGNAALTSLSGLKNLTSIGGDLSIDHNAALTSLGMTGLQKIGSDLLIKDNPMLCTSLAEELMNQVLAGGGIGGEVTISGNKDCTTP
jgi:hypothetical protein